MNLTEDPKWPRAAHWLAAGSDHPAFTVIGVPAHETSISATNAHTTPNAVRAALLRYSTYSSRTSRDLADLAATDLGDIDRPDHADGERRVATALQGLEARSLLFALGGDNSITYSVMHGMGGLPSAGLITLDAHHDLRDGVSNGSPVRRLLDAGLDPRRTVQIGINDFSNSGAYSAYAREVGITVFTREQVEVEGIERVMREALRIAGADGAPIHVDLDMDVCDRSVVPACPASAPGGISAYAVRVASRMAGADLRVRAIDATEVDATQDSPDGRTVRLVALCLLEAAMGRLEAL